MVLNVTQTNPALAYTAAAASPFASQGRKPGLVSRLFEAPTTGSSPARATATDDEDGRWAPRFLGLG
jgi:hypothetical protein